MANFQVDPNKVAEITHDVFGMLEGRRVHLPDILIGLSESLGRVIAAQDVSPIAMREMATVCAEHLERTIRIGVNAKGGNMGDI